MNADEARMFSRDAQRSVGAADCRCAATLATAHAPGAIGIVQLVGDVVPMLRGLTGVDAWPTGRLRLVSFNGIDEGLAVRLKDDVAQVMPHGGVRVVQRVMERLTEIGAEVVRIDDVDVRAAYPEAENEYEALMLSVMARAASPMGVELLLREPSKWRAIEGEVTEEERARSARLSRLIDPPLVVLVGPPNVGKSTLSNALLGRSMSIAVDMPGTTRDYTTALVELAGLVVQWHDTPGIRESDDPIEMRAIAIARSLIERADYLIAMTDAEQEWPAPPHLPRPPHLRLVNKADIARRDDGDLRVSAVTGEGMAEMVRAVRDGLVPPRDIEALDKSRWVFDARLEEVVTARSASRRG